MNVYMNEVFSPQKYLLSVSGTEFINGLSQNCCINAISWHGGCSPELIHFSVEEILHGIRMHEVSCLLSKVFKDVYYT